MSVLATHSDTSAAGVEGAGGAGGPGCGAGGRPQGQGGKRAEPATSKQAPLV